MIELETIMESDIFRASSIAMSNSAKSQASCKFFCGSRSNNGSLVMDHGGGTSGSHDNFAFKIIYFGSDCILF